MAPVLKGGALHMYRLAPASIRRAALTVSQPQVYRIRLLRARCLSVDT